MVIEFLKSAEWFLSLFITNSIYIFFFKLGDIRGNNSCLNMGENPTKTWIRTEVNVFYFYD